MDKSVKQILIELFNMNNFVVLINVYYLLLLLNIS